MFNTRMISNISKLLIKKEIAITKKLFSSKLNFALPLNKKLFQLNTTYNFIVKSSVRCFSSNRFVNFRKNNASS